jgi:hypothetical protein
MDNFLMRLFKSLMQLLKRLREMIDRVSPTRHLMRLARLFFSRASVHAIDKAFLLVVVAIVIVVVAPIVLPWVIFILDHLH